jgi:hypothetical protein
MNQRLTALVLVAVLGLAGAACGGDDSDSGSSNKTGSTLVKNGDQQGSGSDGSVPSDDPPGNTPGGSQSGDDQ